MTRQYLRDTFIFPFTKVTGAYGLRIDDEHYTTDKVFQTVFHI